MQSVREDIEKEHHAIQNSDVVIFFKVAQFVIAFQYHKFLGSKVKYWNLSTFLGHKCILIILLNLYYFCETSLFSET